MKIKITTKGFDYYRFEKDGKKFFDVCDIFSDDELIKCIKKCIKQEKEK